MYVSTYKKSPNKSFFDLTLSLIVSTNTSHILLQLLITFRSRLLGKNPPLNRCAHDEE